MEDEASQGQLQLIESPSKKVKIARIRYPNWEKQETISLVKAYQRQMNEFTIVSCKGRMMASEQKWEKISSLCSKDGVSRDAEQCRKRWQDLSKNYKRIKEWEMFSGASSFWLMSGSSRKDKNLPGNFDREVYDCMDAFMSSKTNMKLQKSLSSKEMCDYREEAGELPRVCAEGCLNAMSEYVEQPNGDPSSQQESRAFSKEQTKHPKKPHNQNHCSQADSADGDPIAEAVENATRIAEDHCSAQVTEVLADVLMKMADAMRTVAENIKKRKR